MEIKKPGIGIGALIVVFAIYALILDDPAAVIVVIVLTIFMLYRALLFLRNSERVASSLRVERKMDKRILRPGVVASVLSSATLSLPSGVQAELSDLLPSVAEGEAPAYSHGHDGSLIASYELMLMAPGETRFRGVRLRLSDAFFSDSMLCMGEEFRAPVLRAVSYAISQNAGGNGLWGNETRKSGLLSGQEIISFRPYIHGDEPSLIDWKLSAKRDLFMVREMDQISGGAPMLIIDLPETSTDKDSAGAFFTLVGGVAEGVLDAFGTCEILIISGANLIRYIPPDTSQGEILLEMSRLAPMVRFSHIFRMPGRAVMDARRRALKGATPLDRILKKAAAGLTSFEVSLQEVMAVSGADEAHLYSLYRGDLSHISQTVLAAKRTAGMKIILYVPRQEAGVAEKLREYRSDGIEVV